MADRIGTNDGHGHAWERPDGLRARCGGPALCTECAKDQALVDAQGGPPAEPSTEKPWGLATPYKIFSRWVSAGDRSTKAVWDAIQEAYKAGGEDRA